MLLRKITISLLTVFLLLSLCGCGSKVPEHIKNPKTEYIDVKDYERASIDIPANYRLIQNGIYAVLDENDLVTGYMRLVEENGEYRCEKASFSSSVD